MKQVCIGILMLIMLSGVRAQEIGQSKDFDYTTYGQMIYWKALTPEEKKVFLHAYLYRTFEIGNELKQDRKMKSLAPRYATEIAEPVYKVFRDLGETGKNDLIDWIDVFYQHEFNREESFNKALHYAFRKLKSGSETMHDVYKRSYPE